MKYNEMNVTEQKQFREWLTGVLKQETAVLTFRKKDGTMRVMKASLREEHFPVLEKKTDRVREKNEDVLSVVDLDLGEWRSFRFDSVERVEFTIE
jgi:hypothetical protein